MQLLEAALMDTRLRRFASLLTSRIIRAGSVGRVTKVHLTITSLADWSVVTAITHEAVTRVPSMSFVQMAQLVAMGLKDQVVIRLAKHSSSTRRWSWRIAQREVVQVVAFCPYSATWPAQIAKRRISRTRLRLTYSLSHTTRTNSRRHSMSAQRPVAKWEEIITSCAKWLDTFTISFRVKELETPVVPNNLNSSTSSMHHSEHI